MPDTLCTPAPAAPRSPTPQGTEAAVATRERLGQGFPGSGESGRPGISSSTHSNGRRSLKTGSSPIGGQGGRSGSLSLQDQLPGWAELERSGSWSETRAQRQRARADLPHFPVGSPGTPLPCPLCLRTTQACLGTLRARTRSRLRGTAGSFWPWWSLHSTLHPRLHTGASNESLPRPRPRVPFFLRPSFFPPISLRRSLVTVGTTWTPWSKRRAQGCGHTEVPVLKRAAGFEARC